MGGPETGFDFPVVQSLGNIPGTGNLPLFYFLLIFSWNRISLSHSSGCPGFFFNAMRQGFRLWSSGSHGELIGREIVLLNGRLHFG